VTGENNEENYLFVKFYHIQNLIIIDFAIYSTSTKSTKRERR